MLILLKAELNLRGDCSTQPGGRADFWVEFKQILQGAAPVGVEQVFLWGLQEEATGQEAVPDREDAECVGVPPEEVQQLWAEDEQSVGEPHAG